MSKVVPRKFFARDTEAVARELLGKKLCRRLPGGEVERLVINETEAYVGPHDAACHAHLNRRTKRTEVMFAKPGTLYVYLVYGMHWLLNIVTEREEYPAAVLIRGAGEYDGPAKLTKALAIDKGLNGEILGKPSGLWIEEGENIIDSQITATPRIGIDYAGEEWAKKPLRFVLKK